MVQVVLMIQIKNLDLVIFSSICILG